MTWRERADASGTSEAADVTGTTGVTEAEVAAAQGEPLDETPFWDLSASEDPAGDPVDGYRWERIIDVSSSDGPGSEPAAAEHADAPATGHAEPAGPPRPEWKVVVTPVEEADRGRGRHRGNLSHLSGNPRMRVWRLRALVAVIVMVVISILVNWKLGLTFAVIVIIADTIYRARKGYVGKIRLTRAQRRTRRQLNMLGRAGYRAMHASPIPDSEDQIDHLVVGPAGVFAIDSEDWDRRLIVRTKSGRQLWHGPFSKKDRLEHALWEAQRATDLLSGAVGRRVTVRPAMAVYGPKVPWDVATIREVDVFSGPRLRKYLRRRARNRNVLPLSDEEIERIFKAASEAFPHHSSGSPAG